MSWSVTAVGKPAAVKAALATQFADAKRSTQHVPHEHRSVGAVEQLVNEQLDFLATIPGSAVTVDAGGSAYLSEHLGKRQGATNVKVEVRPLYGFVEDVPEKPVDQVDLAV